MSRMQRLKRVFHIDIEHCGVCGGRETSALAPTTYPTMTTLPRPYRYPSNNADRRAILSILLRGTAA